MPEDSLKQLVNTYMQTVWPEPANIRVAAAIPIPNDDIEGLFADEVTNCTPAGHPGGFPRRRQDIAAFITGLRGQYHDLRFEYRFSDRSYYGPHHVISIDWTGYATINGQQRSWSGTTTFQFDNKGRIERRWWEGDDIPDDIELTPDPIVSDVP